MGGYLGRLEAKNAVVLTVDSYFLVCLEVDGKMFCANRYREKHSVDELVVCVLIFAVDVLRMFRVVK